MSRNLLARFLYRPYALWRMARSAEAVIRGRTLSTDPEVFHPIYFLSTGLVIEELRSLPVAGKRFLDMGCGSGAIGLFAALGDAIVTACDVNPRAVALTRENLRRHGVAAEVLESNLFTALAGRTFDVICFNIPFYPGEPRTLLDAAFRGGKDLATVRAFIAGCPRFLSDGGTVLVVFSEDVDRESIVSWFASAGFAAAHERIAHRMFERFHLVRFQRGIVPRSEATARWM